MSRVALLTPYSAPVPGGISSFLQGLSRALRSDGCDVSVLSGLGLGDTATNSNLGTGRHFVERARKRLAELRPDILHAHAHWYTLAAAASYVRKNRDAHLVFSFHTTTVPRWHRWFTQLLRRADVVTCVSGAQLADLRGRLRIAGDLRILRPATEILDTDPASQKRFREEHHLRDCFPVLVFAGPLEYSLKVAGVVHLVQSLRTVLLEYPSAKLLVVGDGSLRQRVISAAEEFGNAVEVTGFIRAPRVALSVADLYCHISYQEGLPLSVLEAMSLGRCVVAYPAGGLPEVLDGSNGFLVGSGPEAVGAAISRLAKDPGARARAGELARETVVNWYTWEARLPQIRSIYGSA